MPLYQVCKVKCDFCETISDILVPQWLIDNINFNLDDILADSGFIVRYNANNYPANICTKYACANPACREKLEE
jgi:hypothetical protein